MARNITFTTEYTPDGMRGVLYVPGFGGEDGTLHILTPDRLRQLADEAHAAAHAIEWDRADWLWVGGPPLHLVRKGTGRTLCGGEVDERKGNPYNFEPRYNLCKRCAAKLEKQGVPLEM
jgi:hypothetical protein